MGKLFLCTMGSVALHKILSTFLILSLDIKFKVLFNFKSF